MPGCIRRCRRGLAIPVYVVVALWSAFTVVVYGMILYGSVVQLWGVDNTLTFKHYVTAFARRLGRGRPALDRLGLGQFLDHDADRHRRRTADRRRSA